MTQRLYLYVKAFSDMGSMMDMIILTAMIYAMTDSSAWMAAALGIRTLGGLLSSLSSGVVADKMNRRYLMIGSDVTRFLCILAIIVAPTAWMILLATFAIGFFSSYFAVSFSAEVPQMFGEDNVLETNALISRLTAISMVLGFLGSGVLSQWGGNMTVLSLDAASYLLSAVVLSLIRWNGTAPVNTYVTDKSAPRLGMFRQIGRDLAEVLRYMRGLPLLLIVFFGYLVETFGASSHNVGIPLLAAALDPEQQTLWYGLIWGVWAIGNVVSTMVLPKLSVVKRQLHLSYWSSTICMSMGFISLLSSTNHTLIFLFAFITGVFDAASGTLCNTILQMSENRVRGRVFGVSSLINRCGFGIGFVVTPILLQHMTMPHMVWILHGSVIVTTAICIVVGMRYLRSLAPTSLHVAEMVE